MAAEGTPAMASELKASSIGGGDSQPTTNLTSSGQISEPASGPTSGQALHEPLFAKFKEEHATLLEKFKHEHNLLLENFKQEHSKRKAIHHNLYDNGPYHFVYEPKLGKEILTRDPNWPYQGSKERENEGLTVKPGDEDLPDFAQQQRGKWGQTSGELS